MRGRYAGADFHPDLLVRPDGIIVNKGTDPAVEAYSGFQDTGLAEKLQARQVDTVYITGLATDYCVKATALDAVKAGFRTFVVANACRGWMFPGRWKKPWLRWGRPEWRLSPMMR